MRSYLPASALRRETLGQLIVEHTRRQVHRALSRNDQEIHSLRQRCATTPEKLPYLPFDPITNHGIANLAADGDAHAGPGMIAGLADNDKIFGMDLVTGSR